MLEHQKKMFEVLTDRLQSIFKGLGRRGKLSEADVDTALHEIRLALLEADVNYQVVKSILADVRVRATGRDVSRALNPSQQIIRILNEELIHALGEPEKLKLTGETPRVIMLVGLQGSGKTTTAAKLANWLRHRGERIWLVAADPYRPAAAEQLTILGQGIDIPVFADSSLKPPELCLAGMKTAAKSGGSVVILDTAGRSQLDQPMMDELSAIQEYVQPCEVLLVADAMTGQEAVNIAQGFQEHLGLTGLILTKMDGDARGGAAISMRSVTGVPIKFIGTGEANDALETFEPDRLASRILGMGDVLTLIEKAEASFDQETAQKQAERIAHGEFTLEDLGKQLAQVRRMGPLGKVFEMLPGGMARTAKEIDGDLAERQLIHTQAIIQSMTHYERQYPKVLNASRKKRIAAGSGTTVQEINQLLRQHRQMRKLYKQISKRGLGTIMPRLR